MLALVEQCVYRLHTRGNDVAISHRGVSNMKQDVSYFYMICRRVVLFAACVVLLAFVAGLTFIAVRAFGGFLL